MKDLPKFDVALELKLPRKRSPSPREEFAREARALKDTLKSIEDMKRRTGEFKNPNMIISESENDDEVISIEMGEQ